MDNISQNAVHNVVHSNQHTNRWCALPVPYPEVRVEMPNLYHAQLLLEDYAGQVSEMTAISQYFHHHIVFEPISEELAELEECLSIVEMMHLEMLGEIILKLGVDPKIRTITNNIDIYWNAAFVFYGDSVCDRLAADIAAEKNAIAQYRAHQRLINDRYINELLERIIMDEEHHLRLFSKAYDKYCCRK